MFFLCCISLNLNVLGLNIV